MKMRVFPVVCWAMVGVWLLPSHSWAQGARVDVEVVESPALGGERFGSVGQYERLRGIVYAEVDPSDPRHRDIVNLDKAPINDRGHVEYSTTVEIYRPIDMSHWNRVVYHTVSNRGGAGAAEPALLEMGLALVRVGWQGDLSPTETNIVPFLPIATNNDGSSIAGPALEEFIFNDAETVSTGSLTYPAATLDTGKARLTVRRNQSSPRLAPDGLSWKFTDAEKIQITRPDGFDGGAIYEFIYEARDPIVMGLGFVAMRDVISFLRYEKQDDVGHENPLAFEGLPTAALSLGISQSGRVLRDFLYQGFNEDVSGRIVFDGIHPNIAGSRKTFTNYQFSQPGRWQKQHEDHVFPGDQFPFTYTTLTDSITGRTDGLLERCVESNTCPKIIHSDGEAELWQARSSLIVTDSMGGHIELPDNVRVYLIAGTQHGGGRGVHEAIPNRGICQNLNNPMALAEIRLALSVALHEWVVDGVEPPTSRFPTVKNGGLVSAAKLDFPEILNVEYSASYNPLHVHEHTTLPPKDGKAYTVLVGRIDGDGNMVDGVRHPNLSAAIGTYTGWNLRREGFGEGGQCGGTGSFIPFASNQTERQMFGDSRLSLTERYSAHSEYVQAVSTAAARLANQRLLLPRDKQRIVELARRSAVGIVK